MKKLLIIPALIFASFTNLTYAQDLPEPGKVLADETNLYHLPSGKIKIVTFNSDIANKLIKTFSPCQCFTYSFTFKKATSKGKSSKESCWSFYFKPNEVSEAKIEEAVQ